jgi:hypothetical protein
MLPRYASRREKWLYLLPLIWVIVLIALYAARLPAAHQHGRYVIPVLPSFIVIGVIGTAGLMQSIRSSGLVGRVVKRTYLISAAGLFLFSPW